MQLSGKQIAQASIRPEKFDLASYVPTAPNELATVQKVADDIANAALSIEAGSQQYLAINPQGEITVRALAISSVTVDAVSVDLAQAITANYSAGTELQEGDTLVLTSPSGGTEVWLHNGGSAGDATDFTQIQRPNVDAAFVRGSLSAGTNIDYDVVNGVISVKNQLDAPINTSTTEDLATLFTSGFTVASGEAMVNNNTIGVTAYNGEVWVGGWDMGIWRYNPTTGEGKRYTTSGGAANGSQLPNNRVFDIEVDANGVLYAATFGGGLWKYDIASDTGTVLNSSGGVSNGVQIPNNVTVNVAISGTKVYVALNTSDAATGGMWEYDSATDTGKHFSTSSGVASGDQVPEPRSEDVFVDSNGFVWLAMNGIGAWRYDPSTDTGKTFSASAGTANGLNIPIARADGGARSFAEDSQGRIYVGTNGGGIWVYDPSTDNGIKVIDSRSSSKFGEPFPLYSPYPNSVYALIIKDDVLWAGTYLAGIWQYDINADYGKVYNTSGGVLNGPQVSSNWTSDFVFIGNTLYATMDAGGLWEYNPFDFALISAKSQLVDAAYVEKLVQETVLTESFIREIAEGVTSSVLSAPRTDNRNQTLTAATTGNEAATGLTLVATPKGFVLVIVNGNIIGLGSGVKTQAAYFSADGGTTAKAFADLAAGDELYWNGTTAGFDLDTNDSIDIIYI